MKLRYCSPLLTIVISILSAGASEKGDAEKGKQAFAQCAACHNTDSDEKKVGPSLKGLFARKKLQNGKRANDEDVLAQINQGGGGMPSFGDKLTDQEKQDLLAYLHTL